MLRDVFIKIILVTILYDIRNTSLRCHAILLNKSCASDIFVVSFQTFMEMTDSP